MNPHLEALKNISLHLLKVFCYTLLMQHQGCAVSTILSVILLFPTFCNLLSLLTFTLNQQGSQE